MKRFWYRAKDIHGKKTTGFLCAEDENKAYKSIREKGGFVICLKEVPDRSRTGPLAAKTLADFSNQLAVMLRSGIPLVQAVHMLAQKERHEKLVQIYQEVYQLLIRGDSMSETLAMQGGAFPVLMINLVKAGELGGHMADTFEELGVYYEKNYLLTKKIGSALVYPVFLMGVVVVGLILLFAVVLPEFFALFDSMETLPASTRVLMWISEHLVSHGLLILAVPIPVILGVVYLYQYPVVRRFLGGRLVHMPVAGGLMKKIYTARWARTMSALYGHGVSMVQAVGLTCEVMGNEYISHQMREMLGGICDGMSLSSCLMKIDGIEESLAVSVFIGEETGELATLLRQASDRYEAEAEEASARMVTLLEPLLIVVMGVIVGGVMLSVMLPLMQYYQSIG